MSEDIEITFARRLGEVLSEMRATLEEPAIKRVLTFILSRYGICVTELYVMTLPAAPVPPEPKVILKKADAVMEEGAPVSGPSCPICKQNGFHTQSGVAGHMWHRHHVRKSEYQA